jgi:hypothetical protein
MTQYNIALQVKDKFAFYTVKWSYFIRLSKERIRSTVPSEAGIFQIYTYRAGMLNLEGTHQAFYGGLRATFQEIIDEDCQISFPGKERFREEETYIRYALSSSRDVLNDLLYHYRGKESSGRFKEIFVEESDTMKIAR